MASFLLFFVFSFVLLVDKILPTSGFELRISGVRSDRPTNWATTIAQTLNTLLIVRNGATLDAKQKCLLGLLSFTRCLKFETRSTHGGERFVEY